MTAELSTNELTGPVERRIAEIWTAALGVPVTTADHDFFAGGGDSFQAALATAQVRREWGLDITVELLIEHPAVGAYAVRVAGLLDAGHHPLTHAQKRFLFAEAFAPGAADNLVIEAYELTGPLRPEVLRGALDDVVDRHHVLRTVYPWERGQPVQRVLAGETVPWTEVPPPNDSAGLSTEEILQRVTADLWDTPFQLDKEIPVRARLCRLSPERALLCLQFHHIAFDGSSETTLLADLHHAYTERARGAAPRFSPAPSYLLLGREEERSLASAAAGDVAYWRETLADCPPPCLPLPAKGSGNEAPARESVRHLDGAAVRHLAAAAARCGGPALSALAAGAAMALATRFDVADVCVGTVANARFDPSADEVVGYLVNSFAVPLRGLRRSARAVLTDAAQRILDGLEHARTPFDELVRELGPDRDRHPWFEAWVVLQHAHPDVALGPVTVRSLWVPQPRTARSWLVEALPATDGGWDLMTSWREDVMTDETGEALADNLVAALETMAALGKAERGADHQ